MRGGIRSGFVVALALGLSASVAPPAHASRRESITAKAGIVIDRHTGEVLWQRNPDLELPPASTTKVMTALLAIKSGRLAESFPVSAEAAQAPPSKISVRPGWRLRLRDLLYAVLLNSANDAAEVVAEGVGGSVGTFANQMNAEARELGAMHSHFVNPHGLPAEDHYSTVRDLTTIFSAGLRLPLFRDILETKRFVISPTSGTTRKISLHSHNRLLMSDYPIQVIGKTGWTKAAKKCFVGAASVGGREIVVAVLGSRDLWGDLEKLIGNGSRTEPAGIVMAAAEDVDWSTARRPAATQAAGDDDEDDDDVGPAPRYQVRLASFRDKASATRLRNSVSRSGYRASITRVGRGKHARYRVTVGGYATLEQAQHVAHKLDRAHRVKAVVARAGT